MLTADQISLSQKAEIVDLETSELGQRLGELGFWPGKSIELLSKAPFGGPKAYQLDNTVIALRKDEASQIRVKINS